MELTGLLYCTSLKVKLALLSDLHFSVFKRWNVHSLPSVSLLIPECNDLSRS